MTFFFNTIYSIYTILSRKINLLQMDTTNYYLFNICSNNPVSLKFILKLLDKEFGKPKIIKRTKQLADVYKTHGDNKKLISVTKYKNFVDIKVGLIEVINWAKENINFLKKN